MSGLDDIRAGLFANDECVCVCVETQNRMFIQVFYAQTCVVRINSFGYPAIAAQFFLRHMIIRFAIQI